MEIFPSVVPMTKRSPMSKTCRAAAEVLTVDSISEPSAIVLPVMPSHRYSVAENAGDAASVRMMIAVFILLPHLVVSADELNLLRMNIYVNTLN